MTPAQTALDVRHELGAICGAANVTSGEQLSGFAIDDVVPATSVLPATADEVSAILAFANEHDLVVVPCGGFTRQRAGRTPARVDILLQTARMQGAIHYDPGDLTVGFGAGASIDEIQKTLAGNGQFLPLDVMLPARASIGGVLASNANGPMKSGYGGVRDYCIGIEFVTGDGKIGRGGGRVVKNVAGYDMMKLLIGSYGTLGVITSASFKVFPRPTQTQTFACEFESAADAMRLRDRLCASALSPMCLEVVSPKAHEYLAEPIQPRDPDHHLPEAPITHRDIWTLLVRAAGSDAVLARYRQEIGSDFSREINGQQEEQLWHRISDFEFNVAGRHRNAMLLHLHMPRSDVKRALEGCERVANEQNMMAAVVGRAGTGTLVLALMPLAVDPPSAMQYANAASAIRALLGRDSSAIVMSCPVEAKAHFDVWGSSPNDLTLMRAIRNALDPKQVLNRGRFLV
jgi:glycolate oxidase FAD binding subunit